MELADIVALIRQNLLRFGQTVEQSAPRVEIAAVTSNQWVLTPIARLCR